VIRRSSIVRVLAGTAVTIVAIVIPRSAPGITLITPGVVLHGGGSWATYQEITPWQNDLIDAPKHLDLEFTPHGTALGKTDLLTGNNDFVISGVPFTADQLSGSHKTDSDFISAPVAIGTLSFVLAQPDSGFLVPPCDPNDPSVPDPNKCFDAKIYTGPIRVPNQNLAAMASAVVGTTEPVLNAWQNPDVLPTFGTNLFLQGMPVNSAPAPYLRSDADEITQYLQTFTKATAPTVWAALVKIADPTADPTKFAPAEEPIHLAAAVTRDGVDQQVALLGTGTGSPNVGGAIAPAPPSSLAVVKQEFPSNSQRTFRFGYIQLKNGANQWVTPSTASINAAVAAGGEAPLYALDHPVSGAYPLSWVERLYAPAHGLTVEKTEGLAATIRYLATAGQSKAAAVGEGELTQPMVKEALAAADQIVASNCPGAGGIIETSSDPGRYAPSLAALKSIGPMKHCDAKPGSGTTTTTSTTAPGQLPADTGLGSTGSGSAVGSPTAADSSGLGATSGDSGASSSGSSLGSPSAQNGILTSASLPFPLPASSTGRDVLATALLGAGLYLLVRPLVRKVLQSYGR
jgi:hypothetical protein